MDCRPQHPCAAWIEIFATLGNDIVDAADLGLVTAEPDVVVAAQCEFDRCHQRRGRHIAEGAFRHPGDIHHQRDAAARPDIDRRAADRHIGGQALHGTGEIDRVFGDAGAQRAAGAADEHTVHSAGSQFSSISPTTFAAAPETASAPASVIVELV